MNIPGWPPKQLLVCVKHMMCLCMCERDNKMGGAAPKIEI